MRRGVQRMEAHVEHLCAQHDIELVGSSARGRIRWRGGRIAISIPPIRGQVSYFIALHEIGHLVGRGRSAPRLEAEANAWVWALQHSAVEPTAATRRSIVRRLELSVAGAKPPVPPPAASHPRARPRLLEAAGNGRGSGRLSASPPPSRLRDVGSAAAKRRGGGVSSSWRGDRGACPSPRSRSAPGRS